MRILGVGIATVDIISTVEKYPNEDDEVRAIARRTVRGGNVTNTLVVLSQLGHQCDWAGTLASDHFSHIIKDDLSLYGIGLDKVQTLPGDTPLSCIQSCVESGSRTIVHFRDLPEYSACEFKTIDLSQYDWIHFEGRNVGQLSLMLQHIQQQGVDVTISLEIEKPRDGIESLIGIPDIVFFSKAFAMLQKAETATDFLQRFVKVAPSTAATCTWGSEGAAVLAAGQVSACLANSIDVVDSIAAGDTFNAGYIDAYAQTFSATSALNAAVLLAEKKCGIQGIRLSI